METYKIKIDQPSDIERSLKKFRNSCYNDDVDKDEFESFYLQVKSATEDLIERGIKLIEIGSHYSVKQTIENPICNVLINIDFNPEKPSIFSKLKKFIS